MKKACGYLLTCVFLFWLTKPVYADDLINGVTPQQGKASGTITAKCYEPYSDKTYIRSYAVTVDFWNVGALGGDQYKTLTMNLTGVGDNLDCFLGGITLTSTFDGGPNGFVAGNGELWQMNLVDGNYFSLTYKGYSASVPLENPDIFDGWTEEVIEITPTENPESSCSPDLRGISPSKPGEMVSPGATYYDTEGQEVNIIQERWYINGVNTTSMIWDGKEMTVELQWTCLDHTGYSKTIIIPAYVEPLNTPQSGQASEGPPNTEVSTQQPLLTPLGIVTVISLLVGALGSGYGAWIAVNKFIAKSTKAVSPAEQSSSSSRLPSTPVASSVEQVLPPRTPDTPVPTKSPSQSIPPSLASQPSSENPLPAQNPPSIDKVNLPNLRIEMETEIQRIKTKWQQTRDAVEKLKTLKKKNMIKFIIKQAWETKEWIIDSPVEAINKFTIDPLMEKAMGSHDTSQDGKIIIAINNRIELLKGEMQEMVKETKYLSKEIAKINRSLSSGGK
jgi:hypothetical protein